MSVCHLSSVCNTCIVVKRVNDGTVMSMM